MHRSEHEGLTGKKIPFLLFVTLLLISLAPASHLLAKDGREAGEISNRALAPAILIYADDPEHTSPGTFIDAALESLKLPYTAFYNNDFAGFEEALRGAQWDLIIVGHENVKNTMPTKTLDILAELVGSGQHLIIHSWSASVESNHPLWELVGYGHKDIINLEPLGKCPGILWLDKDHPFFNYPQLVPNFEGCANPFNTAMWGGNLGIVIDPSVPLAEYETGPAAIILGNGGRTVFRSFPDFTFSQDTDNDRLLDGVELWENMIFNVLGLGGPPGAFNKTSPADGAENQPTSLTLTWGSSSGATGYQYCYDQVNNNTCDTSWTSTAGTSAGISGLDQGATYYWQVRATNFYGNTNANGGAWWKFDTAPPPPGAFNKTAPANNATNQPTALNLSWGSSSNVAHYEYCYDQTNNSSCDGSWTSTTSTSAAISGLSQGVSYYWQVRAVNFSGTTNANGGAWWKFTTAPPPPGAFNKSAPANNAINQPTSLNLSWGNSTNVEHYEYCYDQSDDSACDGNSWTSTPGSVTSAAISGLSQGVSYYWQVRAVNFSGTTNANGGAWWKFTTAPPPPGAFNKTAPANNDIDLPSTLNLSWGSSTNVEHYEYCYDKTNNNACNATWTSTGSSTSAVISGLDKEASYYWQARAVNFSGTVEANSGTWWKFTTGAGESFAYLPVMVKRVCWSWTLATEVEDNDGSSQANGPLCFGSQLTGNVIHTNESTPAQNTEDWFKFNWSGSGKVVVNVTGFPVTAQVILYSAGLQSLASVANQGSGNYLLEYNGTGSAGLYYIRLFVPGDSRPGSAPDYTLSLNLQ